MKKLLISVVAIAVILIGGLAILQNVNINRVGADQYYTQITDQGKILESKDSRGVKHDSYEYELPAFNKDGQEKTVTFTAQKQLREHAYLTLFLKDDKGVTSYEEVTIDNIPTKASEKLAK